MVGLPQKIQNLRTLRLWVIEEKSTAGTSGKTTNSVKGVSEMIAVEHDRNGSHAGQKNNELR